MEPAVDLYLDLMIRCLTDWLYDEYDEATRAEGLDRPARAHTMIGLKRLAQVRTCVERVLAEGIPGDLVETGAWRGGTTICAPVGREPGAGAGELPGGRLDEQVRFLAAWFSDTRPGAPIERLAVLRRDGDLYE